MKSNTKTTAWYFHDLMTKKDVLVINTYKKVTAILAVAFVAIATPTISSATTFTAPTYIQMVVDSPAGLTTVDSVGGYIWAATASSRTVVKINKATAEVVSYELPAEAPTNVRNSSVDSNYLWLAHFDSSGVSRINLTTGVTEFFPLGVTANNPINPTFPADDIVSDGTYVWVTANKAGKLVKLNAVTGQKITELDFLTAIEVITDGTNVWVAYENGQKIAKLDRESNSVVFRDKDTGMVQDVSASIRATDLKISGDSIFVSYNGGDNPVRELSATSGDVLGGIGSAANVGSLVVYGDMLWVINSSSIFSQQYDLRARVGGVPTGAPTLVGSAFNHGHGSGNNNAVYDGTNLWTSKSGGGIHKYSAQSYAAADSTPPEVSGTGSVSVTAPSTTVATYSANEAVSIWGLSGADASLFDISSSGVVTFKAASTAGTYSIIIEATDASGNKGTKEVTVTVAPGNSTPTPPSRPVSPAPAVQIPEPPTSSHVEVLSSGETLRVSRTPQAPASITKYVIKLSPGGKSCEILSATSHCDIKEVKPGVEYKLTAIAENSAGQSAPKTLAKRILLSPSGWVQYSAKTSVKNFLGNSPRMTKAIDEKLKRFQSREADSIHFSCFGFAAGTVANERVFALATSRAKAVCDELKANRPGSTYTVSAKVPGSKLVGANRKVLVRSYSPLK